MEAIKVFCVDDEQLTLKLLQNVVPWEQFDMEIAGLFLSAEAALQAMETVRPDVILSDINMPRINGIEFGRLVRKRDPRIRFLLLTGYEDFSYVQASLRLGASDYAAFMPLVWQYIGYYMLLLYSACKSVSPDICEAAKIDGASPRQVDWYINIPLIAPMIKVCLIFAAVGSLKTFDLIYILTNGGPAGATEILGTYMYNSIFNRNRYGFGSAIAIWIVLFCFVFTSFFQWVFSRRERRVS